MMSNEPRTQRIRVQHTQDEQEGDPVLVEAAIYGVFGIVQADRWAHVYHVPTGLWLCCLAEENHAVSCAEALNALQLDWSFKNPVPFRTSQSFLEALELVREFERRDGWIDLGDEWRSHPRYRGFAIRGKKHHLFGSEREQHGISRGDKQAWSEAHETEIKTTIGEMVLDVKQRGVLEELTLRREFFVIHTILEHVEIRAHVREETITIEQIRRWLDEAIAHILQKSEGEPPR